MNCPQPQTRLIRELEQSLSGTRKRIVRSHKQSVATDSPRQQAQSQTVRGLAQAMASIIRERATAANANCPQTVRSRGQSKFANWSRTQYVRNRGPATIDPRHRIVVSAWVSANFPVFIQIISPYEHI
jgi:hypothetical protein